MSNLQTVPDLEGSIGVLLGWSSSAAKRSTAPAMTPCNRQKAARRPRLNASGGDDLANKNQPPEFE